MALGELVERVRLLAKGGAAQSSVEECCRSVLHAAFGVLPSDAEVAELMREVRRAEHRELDRVLDSLEGEEREPLERQTGGGREVIYKSEHRAG